MVVIHGGNETNCTQPQSREYVPGLSMPADIVITSIPIARKGSRLERQAYRHSRGISISPMSG